MRNFIAKFGVLSQTIEAEISNEKLSFDSKFDGAMKVVIAEANEHYKGSYEVTPAATAQIMETKNKIMDDDVIIREIPYFETGNEQGGNTVYIGGSI